MLTRLERFPDTRTDRYAFNPSARRTAKLYNRAASRHPQLRPLWKDWREDRRFALAKLYAAIIRLNADTAPLMLLSNAFRPHMFTRDGEIPTALWRYAGAHRAQKNNQLIACYPTRADAARNREVVMKPGTFFASTMPDASPAEIQRLAERFICAVCAPPVHLVTAPADMARVYGSGHGFSSCMANFSPTHSRHPARFYAYPDNGLALAYITTTGRHDAPVTARSLVNTRAMRYVRVYGDARLHPALEAMGYLCDPDAALDNVKCRADSYNGKLIAPYIDGNCYRAQWDGSADYCVLGTRGNMVCQETTGYASGEYEDDDDTTTCDHCHDTVDNDDTTHSNFHDRTLCSYCRDEHYVYAICNPQGHEDYVRADDCIEVNDAWYLDRTAVLEAHGLVLDHRSEWQDRDDCVWLEYLDEYAHLDDCTELDVQHGEDRYALDDDTQTVTLDGEELTVHEDYDGDTDESLAQAAADAAAERRAQSVTAAAAARRAAAIRRRQRVTAARNRNRNHNRGSRT